MNEENTCENAIEQEEQIRERMDANGIRWRKIYVGGGAHAKNWIQQSKEIYGEENLQIEEVESPGPKCYEESSEKQLRIWVRINKATPVT